jgi:hypothetical protein
MNSTRFTHRGILVTYAAFMLLWIVATLAFRISSMNVNETGHKDRFLPVEGRPAPESTVELGVFVDNVYLFQADSKTFDANGWIWLRWPEAVQKKLTEKELSPDKLVVFGNQIDNWDFSLEPTDEGVLHLPDGRHYQRFRFSGHFYVDYVDFHRYPFQTIRIPMIFEIADSFAGLSDGALDLMIDRESSGIGAYIDITGYETTGYQINTRIHEYASNMGNPMAKERTVRVPQATIEISYRKSANATFLGLLLPLVTVMTLTLFSPSLSSAAWDVRVGIPPMALLTLIFLQQGYREKLPELPYVTFLDTIYNACYLVNIILFGLFLWASNEIQGAKEQDQAAVSARLERIDWRFQIGLTLFMLIAIAANWLAISTRHG